MELAGKAALITGASSGIGEATARLMVAEGARVLGVARGAERLELLASELGEAFVPHIADVSDEAQVCGAIAAAVERFGGLDILVNNAGSASMARVGDIATESWRATMALNLDGVFWACREAVPHLVQSKGCVVNTASISGVAADYGLTAYCVANAGVIELTRCMAIDYAREGVRVNCISPGITSTPMNAAMPDALRAAYDEPVPMGRKALPEEMAQAILFLASERASYITGQNLIVDGGISAHTGQPSLPKIFAALKN